MKISKLLVLTILLLTNFVDLCGTIVKIKLHNVTEAVEWSCGENRRVIFEFMDVDDFEKVEFKEETYVPTGDGSDTCRKIIIRTPPCD